MKDINTLKSHSTLTELMQVITANSGMIPTDTESVCLMQDIIGHTCVGDVSEIANGTQKELFYRIYGIAYGTIEAIKYYVANSENLINMRADNEYYKAEAETLRSENEKLSDRINKQIADYNIKLIEWNTEKTNLEIEISNALNIIQDKEKEIIELKAKLYDLMTN